MTILEAIAERHSVRQYKDQPIAADLAEQLRAEIARCNEESGLNIQLIENDPECFNTFLAHYGRFQNANHYIALVGPKTLPDADEKCGYYGELLVLFAQQLGLRTCWVAGTYGKGKCKAAVSTEEKLFCVISIGFGMNDGRTHRSKAAGKVTDVAEADRPDWFRAGLDAALQAPTAVNQQQFFITLKDGEAVISAKRGPYSLIDLGIVKYHFEAASGHSMKP